MQHVVNKLTFEIACTDEQEALATCENFMGELYNEITSVIEICCNRVSNEQELIQIGKLEVNLHAFKNKFSDKQQYIKLFETAFEKELKKRSSPTTIKQTTQQQTIQQSHLDILFFFLKTGGLPWWANKREADLDKWCNEIINGEEATHFISRLYENKNRHPIWERIAYQLSPAFKAFIISQIPLLSNAQAKLSVLYKDLIDQQKLISDYSDIRGDVISDFVLKNGYEILKEQNTSVIALFEHFRLSALPDNETEDSPETYKASVLKESRKNRITVQDVSYDQEEEKAVEKESAEKRMAGNAGVILLAAFLKNFYTNLNLWTEKGWMIKMAQSRAAYLLHYLGSGDESAFEYDLLLEKVICGIPLQQPIERNITLTQKEKEEADDLLHSVIQHWAALKNTSPNGLRQAFFQREGLLSRKENGWLLQIERKTMDILLEQLPWGYATVILPWNRYLIYTEW